VTDVSGLLMGKSSFVKRAVSSFVLIPFILIILWLESPYTQSLIAIVYIGLIGEWLKLCNRTNYAAPIKSLWIALGSLYISLACFALWFLSIQLLGSYLLLLLLVLVWLSDVGAYTVGMWIRGPRFAPSISPNKTWSGFFGGLFFTAIFGGLAIQSHFALEALVHKTLKYKVSFWSAFLEFDFIDSLMFMVLGAFFGLVAQVGDLLESGMKRKFGIKDSGRVIPGHGGFLDRLDSLLAVALVMGAIGLVFYF
jgi:phosphatidate cytidylyltransferase